MRTAHLDPLRPGGWDGIAALVCGFGDRFCDAPASTLLLQRQVHGSRVVAAGDEEPPVECSVAGADGFRRLQVDADALVTTSPGVVVGVRTADCVPLLLVAPRARWAAAVHAGWKGTLAGIAVAAVAAAARDGIAAAELLASLGPSIGPCCYEVSFELAQQFEDAGLAAASVAAAPRSRPHLDLRVANRLLLERSGLPPRGIQMTGPCTRCERDRYHSFRADPDSGGRQISWIGWRS